MRVESLPLKFCDNFEIYKKSSDFTINPLPPPNRNIPGYFTDSLASLVYTFASGSRILPFYVPHVSAMCIVGINC